MDTHLFRAVNVVVNGYPPNLGSDLECEPLMDTHLLWLRLSEADSLPAGSLDAATLGRAQGMSATRRQSYLAGRRLLALGLAHFYGVAVCPELVSR